ncbi:carbohydrate sulfotransferase 11 isoform X2 [Neodiprion pinetum]|uniref:carbohydrate sulfotransferase 11 isoform X2 n=1 Tax=Neodiprion pinetum TaxID=441929 RepID=UPI001EDEFD74|nr:carbohydrate sulfotransferase 11-like isoform X2 [Neodiprion pinetum]
MSSAIIMIEVFPSLQRMAKFLRWMVIYAMGLTTVTIIGRTLLTEEPSEPILLPEYIEPTQQSDTVYIDSRINSTDYLDEIITTAQMAEIRTELQIRRTGVKSVCQILGNETSPIRAVVSNMIVDTKHGLSWCPIYKAGSSTWMVHFAVLGRTLSDLTVELIERNVLQVNTLARQAFPNADLKSTLELRHTKKFIVVRHPFERLLSAYRDKLENMESRKYYYNKYGRHITQKYRQKPAASNTKREPTFTEFLRFITKEKYFDEHWAPYNQFCRPCALNYDYILKFETFKRDEDFLIQELELNQYLYTKNNVKNVNPQGATTTMISKKYFQSVPKMLLEEVYRVYEKDFNLFDYSPDDYYLMTKI